MGEIKVITSVQRSRRWSLEKKRAMVEQAEQLGMSISAVARKYDVHPNLLFTWRPFHLEAVYAGRPDSDKGFFDMYRKEIAAYRRSHGLVFLTWEMNL